MKLTSECRNFLDKLTEYLHGLLSSQEQDEIEEHLSNCRACREDLVTAYKLFKDEEELSEWEPASERETQSVWEKIRHKISQVSEWTKARADELAREPWFALFEPEPLSCTRGASDSEPAIEHIHVNDVSEGLQSEVFFTKSDSDSVRMKVAVLKEGQRAKHIRLTLTQGSGRERSCSLRDACAVFDDLTTDNYHLKVSESGQDKWNYAFRLSRTGVENG